MQSTDYFKNDVMLKRPYIKAEWVLLALSNPVKREVQPTDGRIRHWVWIEELGTLCITFARLWQTGRDGLQGVFLQLIARLLARKTTQQTARVRLTTGRKELCRGSLARYLRVVTLEDGITVHNTFPDRRFSP